MFFYIVCSYRLFYSYELALSRDFLDQSDRIIIWRIIINAAASPFLLRQHVLSLTTMSTEERRRWAIYTLTRTSIRIMERMIACPIALAHVQSSDPLVSRAILSHYLSTVAFIVQQSHIDTRYIARFNALGSHKARLDRAIFVRILFSNAIISATGYDSYLIFSVARIFCCFWSCTNCERGFIHVKTEIRLVKPLPTIRLYSVS